MSDAAEAWLVECGHTRVFISAINMLHVIDDATLRQRVPMTPAHCNSVLVWQQQLMPVVNLAELLNQPTQSSYHYSCILGWQNRDIGTEYGALAASAFPLRVMIHDSHRVTAPVEQIEAWRDYALCFVEYNSKTVPIIDPARLFDASQFPHSSAKDFTSMIA